MKRKKVNTIKEIVKGRIVGIERTNGSKYNGQITNETNHYITVYDRNKQQDFKMQKSNVRCVRCAGQEYKFG